MVALLVVQVVLVAVAAVIQVRAQLLELPIQEAVVVHIKMLVGQALAVQESSSLDTQFNRP